VRLGVAVTAAAIVLAGSAGCGGDRTPHTRSGGVRPPGPIGSLAVDVLADTGTTMPFRVRPPVMRVRVSLARIEPARAGSPDPPLPDAEPDTLPPAPLAAEAGLDAAPRLEPPVLRHPGTVVAPRGMHRAMTVELDVRIDDLGRVIDVRWAAGAADTSLVGAARRCAMAMEFEPARLAGRPVEVWCRQRFEFAPH